MSNPKQPKNVLHCFVNPHDWYTDYAIFTNKCIYRHNRLVWYVLYYYEEKDHLREVGDNDDFIREVATFGDYLGREVSWGSLPEALCKKIVEKMKNPIYG